MDVPVKTMHIHLLSGHGLNLKRFISVKVSYPIRDNSYMECDRDMVPVNSKKDVELSDDWRCELRRSRVKPSAFHVIDATQYMFMAYQTFLKSTFKATCPIKTHPIREM